MNIRWYLNRLRSMSLKEVVFYRIHQFINTKYIFRLKTQNYRTKKIELNPKFKGPKYSKAHIIKLFKNYNWSYLYSFFDTNVDLKKDLCWRQDYKSKKISNICYSASINKQDYIKHGDVKYISELSRLHFLPFLALKLVADDCDKPYEIYRIIKKWNTDNPLAYSINYTSGIEVAIRSINLIYTHHILNVFNLLYAELDELIKQLVDKHNFFLKNHLSLYSSSNNHLVGELVGLAIISSYFKGGTITRKNIWKDKMLKKLLAKYNDDGMDDELSMRYHLAVTDHFINGLQFAKNSGFQIEKVIFETLMTTKEFSKHINYFGIDSNFGDNDSSFLIYPFFDNLFSYSSSINESLNILLTDRREESIDFRNYLIFGENAFNAQLVSTSRTEPNSKAFLDSGYVFFYDNTNKIKLTFDVGSIGDNRLMAHGHSDQLSFTVQKNDQEIIVDPGTYQYHKHKTRWRQYFRGITSHNCISISGKNHALSLNRMSWINGSEVTIEHISITEEISTVRARTNAFNEQGVDYSREIVFNALERKIVVNDVIQSHKNEDIMSSYFLHFHPDILLENEKSEILVKLSNGEKVKLRSTIFEDSNIIRGDMETPFGWYSDTYDKKRESFSLISQCIVKKGLNITTEFFY